MQLVKWIKEERKASSPSSAPIRSTTAAFILRKGGLAYNKNWLAFSFAYFKLS